MFEKTAVLFLYAETPVHWGAGSSVGAIDLPIQRERHTGHPIGQAAGIKGSVRDFVEKTVGVDTPEVIAVFGPDTKNADKHAGCVSFGDARIVLFPVRSLRGTFAYATCPLALSRLGRLVGRTWNLKVEESQALLPKESLVLLKNKPGVVLEESYYARAAGDVEEPAEWISRRAVSDPFWAGQIRNKLVVLSDTDFQHLVRSATFVEAHTKIDDLTGTVADGALFQAEYVPCDSLFFVPIAAAKPFNRAAGLGGAEGVLKIVEGWLNKEARIQTGADASTGRGIVSIRFLSNGGSP